MDIFTPGSIIDIKAQKKAMLQQEFNTTPIRMAPMITKPVNFMKEGEMDKKYEAYKKKIDELEED